MFHIFLCHPVMTIWLKLVLWTIASLVLWIYGNVPLPVAIVFSGLLLFHSIQIGYHNVNLQGNGNIVRVPRQVAR